MGMNILLLGEYSNVHATLAEGLRARGHRVTVASNGDFWKNYRRDIDLARPEGRWGGLRLMARVARWMPRWAGYDVVQFINPMFLELRAERIAPVFERLRRKNRHVVLGAFGMDYYWVKTCCNDRPLRYSDFNIGDTLRNDADALRERRDWLGTAKQRLNERMAEACDGIVTGLYEYDVCYHAAWPQKTHYIPYPVDIPYPVEPYHGGPLRLFIGINEARSAYKGTDIMLDAARRVAARHPQEVELRVARSVPFAEYEQMMNTSHVVLDQLYSYTPAMNGLLAMSKGLVCVGGGEPECYDILGETSLRPIVNVQPSRDSVEQALEQLVGRPELVSRLQAESIAFIRRHHATDVVARRYEQFYEGL